MSESAVSRLGELKVVPRASILIGSRFRKEYSDIVGLATDIKTNGLISPLAVRESSAGYELAAGGRRIKAIDSLGWQEVSVRIFPADTDDLTIRTVELAENIQRKSMTYAEEVEAQAEIHRLYVEKFGPKVRDGLSAEEGGAKGHSITDTAKLLGVSQSTLSNNLKLAKAIKSIPALGECKTQQDATILLKKMEKDFTVSDIVKKVEAERAANPDKVKDTLDKSYIIDDFFSGVQGLQIGSYDLIEVDPPYGIDFNTRDDEAWKLANRANYNEVDKDQYQTFLSNLFRQCYRLAATNSWLICWFAPDPWFEVVFQEATKAGFRGMRRPGVWTKPNGGICSQLRTQLSSDVEYFFYLRKGDPGIQKCGHSSMFPYPSVSPGNRIHPTERPIEMIEDLLSTFTFPGSNILVPFAGSGNTLLAAHNQNMKATGFDLSEEYKNGYSIRVHSGKYKSY